MKNYIIASSKNWFKIDQRRSSIYKSKFIQISKKEDLTLEIIDKINPRYIFFPQWSWRVDSTIYDKYECVVFHTAPLPYGRGGSPIQNLILRGFTQSPVCALKMTDIIDGGPIYSSKNVSLEGNLSHILDRIAITIDQLIDYICSNEPFPNEQEGQITQFKRLSHSDNELLPIYNINQLYDRIRMVDHDDYPSAYIQFGKFKIELHDAVSHGQKIFAKIVIKNDD
jgi:methionyl-tRNA formyltransferase